VLPNGVIFDGVAADCGASIREKYKKPIIGFLGSFEYFIDFDLMLNAAERLPNYTFLMVGTGREYQNVKNKIDAMGLKNVVLTGGCPHSEITKYIDAMDICLNIFKKIKISHSACPIKLFEYLSMKKPVISTRLNEIKNIDDGFLFYADTTEELVEAINYIMENEEVALEHSRKGSSVVRDKYQWPAITQKLLDIIKDASGMKGSR
jgi:glycosyltransferase involved in cell wall biosynthesis